MRGLITRYMHWLHTQWPAGRVEKLPLIGADGSTALPGVRIVGDLTGIPLLKFSSASGADAVRGILSEPEFATDRRKFSGFELAIIGAGVAGVSAAIEAQKGQLRFVVIEGTQPFSTILNFPKQKPIFTYPAEMKLRGGLQVSATVKEDLVVELEGQRCRAGIEIVPGRINRIERDGAGFLLHYADERITRALRVIVAIGRSGNFRKLGCPGEDLGKVYNRLFDPSDFSGQRVVVVGGGDSALETAIALTTSGAHVTLSYRRQTFSRPKPENVAKLQALTTDPFREIEVEAPVSERVTAAMTDPLRPNTRPGSLRLALGTVVKRIEPREVILQKDAETRIPNDVVFTMLGREAPLGFLRRSGLAVRGDWTVTKVLSCLAFLLFCVLLYHWKSNHPAELPVQRWASGAHAFPFNVPAAIDAAGGKIAEWSEREGNLLFTIRRDLGNPAFYYTLAYCVVVVTFGFRRIRDRRTPYVTWQTLTLMTIQCLPLFLLPEIILPWMGRNGWFEANSPLRWPADHLFESYDGSLGHERAYWRAYGFILAFPLNVYNVFTERPMWLWLAISFLQTCVVIPLLILRWGKGAYCGWICSCGALAETLGDRQRTKMPHGPFWNRLNMVGQAVLLFAVVVLGLRILGWVFGDGSSAAHWYGRLFEGIPFLNYSWSVDILMAGIFGLGLYFWFSGRVWCRFACPLAALMHIYTRFSRFRIFPDKPKCISCNLCTAVCHQGIDVMSFANKGLPMADPQCVRCSACVEQCPTGVLSFGRFDKSGDVVLDRLPASPVRMREEIREGIALK